MYLNRIIYASTATDQFSPDDVKQILSSARKHNEKNNITGLLVFSHKYFLQVLEGGRERINETYVRILDDARHIRPIILDYSEIAERDFDSWSMGFVPELSMTRNVCLKFSKDDMLDPYHLSGPSALRMLRELKQTLACG